MSAAVKWGRGRVAVKWGRRSGGVGVEVVGRGQRAGSRGANNLFV